MIDHTHLARRAFTLTALPPPLRRVEDVMPYLTRLLGLLPVEELAGYVKSFRGAENTRPLPDGTLVRVGRVMYPDGQIYKIMNDVPNGGPQWVAEDVRPELYVPYTGPHEFPPPSEPNPDPEPDPDPPPELIVRINMLEEQMRSALVQLAEKADTEHVRVVAQRVEAINTRFASESSGLNVHKPLPPYEGTGTVGFWGGKFTVTSWPK
jgi:hypothetical protein